jgi:hypothetical protein
MKKITAIKIDCNNNKIDEVKINGADFEEINRAIDCDCFCVGARLPNGDILWVDDEGWISNKVKRVFEFGKGNVFAGNGLILGQTASGNSTNVKSKLLDVAMQVQFAPAGWEITPDIRAKAMASVQIFPLQ